MIHAKLILAGLCRAGGPVVLDRDTGGAQGGDACPLVVDRGVVDDVDVLAADDADAKAAKPSIRKPLTVTSLSGSMTSPVWSFTWPDKAIPVICPAGPEEHEVCRAWAGAR
jgi:hypothetical protein